MYALLVESLDDEYEADVLKGALAGARDAEASLLCVAGGVVGGVAADNLARNFAFDLVPKHASILALVSAIGAAIGPDQMEQWLARYQRANTCCVGQTIPGYPSVCVDNLGGMRKGVDHLLNEHSCSRIAFIGGPAASREAQDRLAAYKQALQDAHLVVDERLILEGDYTKPSGSKAVSELLDERRIKVESLDALVSANDYMALGAMDELQHRNVQVPGQLAIVGFDDVESARLARPQLTTVRQAAVSLGREGIHLLTNSRAAPSDVRVLPTELVVRRSCGCNHEDVRLSDSARMPTVGLHTEASFVQRRQIILAEMARAARGRMGAAGSNWETRLFEALVSDLRGNDSEEFSRTLAILLRKMEWERLDGNLVQVVLTSLRQQSLPCVEGDTKARNRLEEVLHEARILVGAIGAQAEARHQGILGDRFRAFSKQARAAVFGDEAVLSEIAAQNLPALGVDACVIAELDDSGDLERDTSVVFGFGPGGRRLRGERLPPRALASYPLVRRAGRALFLLPIVCAGQPLGAAVLCASTIDGLILEDLRDLLGTLLAVCRLRRAGSLRA